jgi:CheY-like chemotaxis protein
MRNAVKVLIVDDDKASGTVLGEVVKRLGLKPVITNKPADALNVVRLQTVHAAIVDVLLPKMSGVDLVEEFRKTKFADNPVVFVSGVFKDKNFAAETLKKTQAVDFLFKPFGPDELTQALTKALGGLISDEKWSAPSLLTRKFGTVREYSRAIENLEQIKGPDFPFVLSFILNAGLSGNLNIVNEAGEIFGVNLNKGAIIGVDSAESLGASILALISNGFLAQEDWDHYQANGAKNFPLERLVEEGLVSPHAVAVARQEQILNDFRAICSGQTLQISFAAQDDSFEQPRHAVRPADLMKIYLMSAKEFFSAAYLNNFYETVAKNPLQLAPGEDSKALWSSAEFEGLDVLREVIASGGSIDDLLSRAGGNKDKALRALHLLVLNRSLVFDDVNHIKNMNLMLERYRKLYAELSSRTPDKIFEYFGASANSSKSVLDGIRDEYIKSNNPELVKKENIPELYDLCVKCQDLVNKAHEMMTDELKRTAFFEDQKVKSAERTKEANKLVAEGLDLLRKGQFHPALAKLKESTAMNPTTLGFLIGVWAEIKCGAGTDKTRLQEMFKKLETLPLDDRKSAYYFMALGLVKRAMGDASAAGYFEKALQMDSLFVEARRELNAMAGAQPKKEKVDLFTGDITQVVSQLFRRKAD